jgi:hypothetical protein
MPRIGIFWVYRGSVLGRAIDLSAGEEGVPGLLDSPDSHADLWENDLTFLSGFPELRSQEYFSLPRGRVLWQVTEQVAVIYADKKLLNETTQQKIQSFFQLECADVSWRTDPHYTTNNRHNKTGSQKASCKKYKCSLFF